MNYAIVYLAVVGGILFLNYCVGETNSRSGTDYEKILKEIDNP